jgi:hypothetical protein
MVDVFQQRIRAAAIAGWWTLLIATGFLTLAWIFFVLLVSTRPSWYRALLGPGTDWDDLQTVGFWAIAVFKVCLWLMGVVVVWLTLWSRQLARR